MHEDRRNRRQQRQRNRRRRAVGQQGAVTAGIPVIGVRRRRLAVVSRAGMGQSGRGANLVADLYRPRRLERLGNRRHEDAQPDGKQAGPDHKFLTADT